MQKSRLGVLVDGAGDLSAIRVALIACLVLGGLVILSGLIGWFLGMKDAVLMVGAGSGLIGTTGIAKAWQAQSENHDR